MATEPEVNIQAELAAVKEVHKLPMVKGNPQTDRRLVCDLGQLDSYLETENEDRVGGVDCEASSLDTRRALLAGISVSLDPYSGIYIPTGHRLGTNLPVGDVVERLAKKFNSAAYKALCYNTKYDANTIQRNSKWFTENHLDVLELVYLDDPDRKEKNLKLMAHEELGFEMAHFESLFTAEEIKAKIMDITTKHPMRCLDYATDDAIATLRLYVRYKHIIEEFSMAVKVDTKLVEIVRRMEHNGGLRLNGKYIDEMISILDKRKEFLEEMIFRIVGSRFELDSPKQLGIALFEKAGIPSQGMTTGRSPQYKTDAETMEKLAETYPVVQYVIAYRKVTKAKSTYFKKLKRLDELKIPVRFSFNIYAAPTFRFAAPGGDPEKDGMTGVNIQAVSNGEQLDFHAVDLKVEGQEDNYLSQVAEDDILIVDDLPATDQALDEAMDSALLKAEGLISTDWSSIKIPELKVLPWVINRVPKGEDEVNPLTCIRETCNGCPAHCAQDGVDITRRLVKNVYMVPSVRQSFMAPEGYTLVSFDYDRQELVIGANMSGERKWLDTLGKKGDMHAMSAASAFHLDLADFDVLNPGGKRGRLSKEEAKAKRDIGKILNFAILYGATGWTLARKANISTMEGEQIYDGFRKGHPQLFSWITKTHLFARKNGYTTTYFGRRRWLKQWYNGNRKDESFADRSAVNTAIQGTGAEVTRIAMVKVDKKFKDLGLTRKDLYFAIQIHDELMFAIRDDIMWELIPIIADEMAFNVKSWQVQLSVAPKAGKVWGHQKSLNLERVRAGERVEIPQV